MHWERAFISRPALVTVQIEVFNDPSLCKG